MTNLFLSDPNGQMSIQGSHSINDCYPRASRRIEHLVSQVLIIELLAIAGTCFLTSVIYFEAVLTQWPSTGQYIGSAVAIAILVLLVALGFKQYLAIQAQSRDRYMWSGIGAVLLAFSLFLSFLFLFKITDWYSRGTFFFQFVGAIVAMLVVRGAMHSHIRSAIQSGTIEARRAVLIGDASAPASILEKLRRSGIHWVGVLPLPALHGHAAEAVAVEGFSKDIRELVERCRSFRPDDILLLTAPWDLPKVTQLVAALSELPTNVHIIPAGVNELWGSAKVTNFGGTVTVQVLNPPLSLFDKLLKRGFDLCVAGLGLLVLSPLLCIIALAIKIDSPGPVFFRQNRHGYNNEIIPVIKLRTMGVVEDGETAQTFTQATANDPRLTPLGRILRRSNMDELPQLINVLRGEMSIVGPRPHPIALNAMFQERIVALSRRHNVKPGLTGWAQVNGFRGETDTIEKMRRRIDYDLYYIDNWSFMFDLKIIVLTVFSKSAYMNAA
jgi:Undecaprenyl-phosphate glucose phosphotransferase